MGKCWIDKKEKKLSIILDCELIKPASLRPRLDKEWGNAGLRLNRMSKHKEKFEEYDSSDL